MDTIKFEKKDSKMVAHRGVSGIKPENTIEAFTLAGEKTYYGIECDVHTTLDKKYVVNHDFHLERCYGAEGQAEEKTLAELKELKNVENGAPIPEYIDYLEVCKKYNKIAVVEIKGLYSEDEIKGLVEITKNAGYLHNTVFIAFDLLNLIRIREMLPEQTLQYLTEVYNENILDALNRYNLDIDIRHRALTKEMIDEVHENGHVVNAWTVDDPELAERYASWGIDMITSNILE